MTRQGLESFLYRTRWIHGGLLFVCLLFCLFFLTPILPTEIYFKSIRSLYMNSGDYISVVWTSASGEPAPDILLSRAEDIVLALLLMAMPLHVIADCQEALKTRKLWAVVSPVLSTTSFISICWFSFKPTDFFEVMPFGAVIFWLVVAIYGFNTLTLWTLSPRLFRWIWNWALFFGLFELTYWLMAV